MSRKVFCGAIRPRITGVRERVEPRRSRRSEPWLSPAVDTKPGRNLDGAPAPPPKPWRRAPSRDSRDSTAQRVGADHRAGDPGRSGGRTREPPGVLLRSGRSERGRRTFTHGCALRCSPSLLLLLPFPSLLAPTLFSLFLLALFLFSLPHLPAHLPPSLPPSLTSLKCSSSLPLVPLDERPRQACE